jgi:hypothetical protein
MGKGGLEMDRIRGANSNALHLPCHSVSDPCRHSMLARLAAPDVIALHCNNATTGRIGELIPLDYPVGNVPKLSSSICTTNRQPSTSTNNRSLKGTEIIAGGSIIIPIDAVTEAMTISRMRKGK